MNDESLIIFSSTSLDIRRGGQKVLNIPKKGTSAGKIFFDFLFFYRNTIIGFECDYAFYSKA